MSKKVLISDDMSPLAKEILEKKGIEVTVKTGMKPDELKEVINDYDGLIVRSVTTASADVIEAAPNLKVIGRAGAGVDNIDLSTAKKKDVVVMNTPGGNTNATAEHAIAMLFSLYKNIPAANESTHKGLWEKKKFKGMEVKGKTIGIIGFGNVAQRVAIIANGLGMKVQVFSISIHSRETDYPHINFNLVPFEKLIETSDIISLHGVLPSDGRFVICEEELNMMKKNAVIINAARGKMIDVEALKKALDNGVIRGAALDVFPEEPATESVLFGTKNLILTPHIAASTEEAQIMVAEQVADQVAEYLNNGNAINTVG